LKRIVFLMVGVLLVLGLVLPGCGGGGGGGGSPYHGLVNPGFLTIGVIGDMNYEQGQDARDGGYLAKADVDTFVVNTTNLQVKIVVVDNGEIDNPLDSGPYVTAQIPNCDFMVGGFRTEGVVTYMPQLMAANMTYIDCGAATTSLAMKAVTFGSGNSYNANKYFFRGTPMNDYLLNHSLSKLFTSFLTVGEIIWLSTHNFTTEFIPQIALVAESALWTQDGQKMSQASIERLGLNVSTVTYQVGTEYTEAQVANVLNTIPSQTNMIITILSGPVGISYANAVHTVFPNAMSVGINVEAQASSFPTAIGDPSYALTELFLDGWASGANITSSTSNFVDAFVTQYGHLPLYTAGTYDAIKSLVAAVVAKGSGSTTIKYKPGDIVTYLEGSVTETAAGNTGFYPEWDGTTKGTWTAYPGATPKLQPALNQNQVLALYPWLVNATFAENVSGNLTLVPWSYEEDDWTMPPLPTHDLIYGVKWDSAHAWATSIASQWQYVGGNLTKVCIWPNTAILTYSGSGLAAVTSMPYFVNNILPTLTAAQLFALEGYPLNPELTAADLWDQYGWWNFKYPGTVSMNITTWVLSQNLTMPYEP
jgi:branched-chain amino acid transport system substrate-binding protein